MFFEWCVEKVEKEFLGFLTVSMLASKECKPVVSSLFVFTYTQALKLKLEYWDFLQVSLQTKDLNFTYPRLETADVNDFLYHSSAVFLKLFEHTKLVKKSLAAHSSVNQTHQSNKSITVFTHLLRYLKIERHF